MINGIGGMAQKLLDKVENVVKAPVKLATKILKIFSPSHVSYEIGAQTIAGMTQGISDNADNPTNAVGDMVNTMIDSMSMIPDALAGMTDLNPTITPVLDLTQMQAGADKMTDMVNTAPTVGVASLGQAASISAATAAAQGATDGTDASGAPTIKFEQNNYSPESLSPIEIYRQTRNQLSQAKAVLAHA
jgi:hypothetical protein